MTEPSSAWNAALPAMTLAATWLRLKIDFARETPPVSSRGSKDPAKAMIAASAGEKSIPAAKATGKDMLTVTDPQTRTGIRSTAATMAAQEIELNEAGAVTDLPEGE